MFSWGRNEHGQQGGVALSSKSEPCLMSLPEGRSVVGAACGPAQVGHVCACVCVCVHVCVRACVRACVYSGFIRVLGSA